MVKMYWLFFFFSAKYLIAEKYLIVEANCNFYYCIQIVKPNFYCYKYDIQHYPKEQNNAYIKTPNCKSTITFYPHSEEKKRALQVVGSTGGIIATVMLSTSGTYKYDDFCNLNVCHYSAFAF